MAVSLPSIRVERLSEEARLRLKLQQHEDFRAKAGEWFIRTRGGEDWKAVALEIGLRISAARELRRHPEMVGQELAEFEQEARATASRAAAQPAVRTSITAAELAAFQPDPWAQAPNDAFRPQRHVAPVVEVQPAGPEIYPHASSDPDRERNRQAANAAWAAHVRMGGQAEPQRPRRAPRKSLRRA